MKTLFLLEGEHAYFGTGGGAGVCFVPTRSSRYIADKAGLRFIPRESGLRICFDPRDLPKLNAYTEDTVEPLGLTILVRPAGDDFWNYTAFPEVPQGWFLMGANTDGDLDPLLFTRSPASPESLVGGDALTANGTCSGSELATTPAGLVRLACQGEKGRAALQGALEGSPQACRFVFKNRKTFWRYFIPCDGNPEDLRIDDRSGSVSFGLAGGLRTRGHPYYARFVSDRPLGLHRKGEARFQLTCTGGGRARTLVKALPNAPSDPLHCMALDSGKVYVSDIFVNNYVYGR